MQRKVLADILKACKCKDRLDPAVSDRAIRESEHLLDWYEIRQLQPGHSDVDPNFLHGPHCGVDVKELTQQLLDEDQRQSFDLLNTITPLVAARYRGMLVVVFGNRRTKALQDYVSQRGHWGRGRPRIRVEAWKCISCLLKLELRRD